MLTVALNPGTHFLQRTWDEECVVYVVESGETHLLSSACTFLLDRLESGPVSIQMLTDEFLSSSDDLTLEDISSLLGDVVHSLGRIGLIQTVENPS